MSEWIVSRAAARRFLLDSLQLGPQKSGSMVGPRSLGERIRALQAVQIDPVARVGRNQDLVLYARDRRYRPENLDALLADGEVFEYRANEACVMPIHDYLAFEGVRRRIRERLKPELERYHSIARDIIHRIEEEGPLPARSFDSSHKVLGYWDTENAATKATSHVLNLLYDSGYLMVVKRDGVTRFFDVPERAVPDDILREAQSLSPEEADERLFDKYVDAYRLVSSRDARLGWSRLPMARRRSMLNNREQDGRVVRLVIDGAKSPYYVSAHDVDSLKHWESHAGWRRPIRFVPPLDNCLWDRDRLVDLFDFYYRWEIYVPPQKRQFGVYAMPILAGDRFIGRIDPEFQRDEAALLIHNIAFESGVRRTPAMADDIKAALGSWAARLGAKTVRWVRSLDTF